LPNFIRIGFASNIFPFNIISHMQERLE